MLGLISSSSENVQVSPSAVRFDFIHPLEELRVVNESTSSRYGNDKEKLIRASQVKSLDDSALCTLTHFPCYKNLRVIEIKNCQVRSVFSI